MFALFLVARSWIMNSSTPKTEFRTCFKKTLILFQVESSIRTEALTCRSLGLHGKCHRVFGCEKLLRSRRQQRSMPAHPAIVISGDSDDVEMLNWRSRCLPSLSRYPFDSGFLLIFTHLFHQTTLVYLCELQGTLWACRPQDMKWSEAKWNEVKRNEMKWSKMKWYEAKWYWAVESCILPMSVSVWPSRWGEVAIKGHFSPNQRGCFQLPREKCWKKHMNSWGWSIWSLKSFGDSSDSRFHCWHTFGHERDLVAAAGCQANCADSHAIRGDVGDVQGLQTWQVTVSNCGVVVGRSPTMWTRWWTAQEEKLQPEGKLFVSAQLVGVTKNAEIANRSKSALTHWRILWELFRTICAVYVVCSQDVWNPCRCIYGTVLGFVMFSLWLLWLSRRHCAFGSPFAGTEAVVTGHSGAGGMFLQRQGNGQGDLRYSNSWAVSDDSRFIK